MKALLVVFFCFTSTFEAMRWIRAQPTPSTCYQREDGINVCFSGSAYLDEILAVVCPGVPRV